MTSITIVCKHGVISSVFISWFGTFPTVSHDSGQFFFNFSGFISCGFVGSREIHSHRNAFIWGQRLYKLMHFLFICLILLFFHFLQISICYPCLCCFVYFYNACWWYEYVFGWSMQWRSQGTKYLPSKHTFTKYSD